MLISSQDVLHQPGTHRSTISRGGFTKLEVGADLGAMLGTGAARPVVLPEEGGLQLELVRQVLHHRSGHLVSARRKATLALEILEQGSKPQARRARFVAQEILVVRDQG